MRRSLLESGGCSCPGYLLSKGSSGLYAQPVSCEKVKSLLFQRLASERRSMSGPTENSAILSTQSLSLAY